MACKWRETRLNGVKMAKISVMAQFRATPWNLLEFALETLG